MIIVTPPMPAAVKMLPAADMPASSCHAAASVTLDTV